MSDTPTMLPPPRGTPACRCLRFAGRTFPGCPACAASAIRVTLTLRLGSAEIVISNEVKS